MSFFNCFISTNALWAVANSLSGIPGLPDLTQPQQLVLIARSLPIGIAVFLLVVIGLGIAIALLNFSLKPQQESSTVVVGSWIVRYTQLLQILQHAAVVLTVLTISSLLCFTLANRYHFWEYSRFARSAITAPQLEQLSPQIRYTVKEPYNYMTEAEGKSAKVRDERDITKVLPVNSSNIQVKISKILVQNAERYLYSVNFLGEYEVKNTIPGTEKFIATIAPPAGFSLLENFVVEQDGQKLARNNSGSYEFPLQIASNGTGQLRVLYQAQGTPRWLYKTKGELLSNFNLSIDSNFKNLDVLNGLLPSRTEKRPDGKTISWTFSDGASVPYSFGAGITVSPASQSGLLPRLLIATPAIWLWWLFLLYLSIPLRIKDIAISAGVAISSILMLVYTSRLVRTEFTNFYITPEITWLTFSLLLLSLAWGLGKSWRSSLAAIVCTITGLILPVLAFLNNYNGLTLSIAALLSVIWLVVCNWHEWYPLESRMLAFSDDRFGDELDSYLKLNAGMSDSIDSTVDESVDADLEVSLKAD
jgi:hypothetical protein